MRTRLNYLVNLLDNEVRNNKFHKSLRAIRIAGNIECLLVLLGCLNSSQKFEYLRGGKKYFPWLGDFTWEEGYCHFILRMSREYISKSDE
jgi:hypothetical protein